MVAKVRVMGLDVGMKTIGVAVSDELGLAAHPVEVIARRGTAADLARVNQLVTERQVGAIVVGLPLELSGDEGRRARRVRMFMDALEKRLGPEVAIHEWDERFSTAAVERVLVEADLSRQKRRRLVDKQAAAYILQGWLDAQRRAQ
jgi:putative holliday junction resolvase